MGKFSRDKGMRGQRWVCNKINEEFGLNSHSGAQARDGSDDPDCTGVPGWWIEHKEQMKASPAAALRQAIGDCDAKGDKTKIPIAIIHDTGKRRFCAMKMDDFYPRFTVHEDTSFSFVYFKKPDFRRNLANTEDKARECNVKNAVLFLVGSNESFAVFSFDTWLSLLKQNGFGNEQAKDFTESLVEKSRIRIDTFLF